MISEAFAATLHSGRADFNARFAAARRLYPELQADVFAEFLRTAVDELLRAVENVNAQGLGEVTTVAYDTALELVGQKIAGSGSRLPSIAAGWRRVLPKIAGLVAIAPGRLIPAVCNAIYQLAATPAARPEQWIEIMERLGPACPDAETFLKLGQLAAWRSGLAHFREGAIAAADALPQSLVLAALGANSGSSWPGLRVQFLASAWFDPAQAAPDSFAPRIVAQVGVFRGFGGLFVEPPLVAAAGEHFLIRCDTECWLLTVDAFGATFHRGAVNEFVDAAAAPPRFPQPFKIKGTSVLANGVQLDLAALGDFTSAAQTATTLALTSSLTHAVTLVAVS